MSRFASVFITASITSPDSRSRASPLCHTPSMCCRDDDRLLRVVEDRAVAAAVDHVGDQFLDEQVAGRLAGGDQIGLVVALVRRADGHQVDRRAFFVVGLALGLHLDADFAGKRGELVAEPVGREHLLDAAGPTLLRVTDVGNECGQVDRPTAGRAPARNSRSR